MNVEVLLELKIKNLDKTFTYHVPDYLKEKIKIGKRVLAPFGNQKLEGFILKINNEEITYDLKDIIDVIDEDVILNEELLEIGKYISKKTLCTLISCYQTMLPKALKAQNKTKINKRYVTYLKLNEIPKNIKSEKQKQILDLLKEGKKLKTECIKISPSSVKTLLQNNVIHEIKEEEYRLQEETVLKTNKIKLSQEQQNVVDEVLKTKNKFVPYLLHGVTGSGKTEVYMTIIEDIIKSKNVIVLVPEISLTPQFIEKFQNRFGNKIAILHSALSDGERYDEWRKIKKNKVNIVIGARSAVFAPVKNLGLVIIDEEHSQTYKQENNPKYNAIDVALFRAKKNNCSIVLGSATPSIESYTRAKTNVYKLLELKTRVNASLPIVKLVDMKEEIKSGNRVLSNILIEKINERINKNEQVILLLNRRGYTTIATCKNCGYVHNCPNCDIPLIYHKSSNTMRCHYCGYGDKKLENCPICKSKDIIDYGMGTEKLEQIVNETFKNAKTLRMDIDTTSKKGSHKKLIDLFKSGEYNILIGTQMIAKGLDFANVTLVGVINADSTLNIPDFRSGERTFQLLNQVSGRAGRGLLKGEVIIQGFNINNYSIVCASTHNYLSFYEQEMSIRKKLNYPPFCNISKIEVKGKNYEQVYEEATKISKYLSSSKAIILGPSSASMPKINNIYQVQIILKYKNTKDILENLKFIVDKYKSNKNVNIDVDINCLKI